MKRYITILFVAMSVNSIAVGQNITKTLLGAKVDILSFDYEADSVKLDLVYDFEQIEIGSNQSAIFTPKIYKEGNTLTLPTVVAQRRGAARSYDRAVALGGQKSAERYDNLYGAQYQVVDLYGSDKQSIVRYSTTIPYESWMVGSQLYLDCTTYGCCSKESCGVLIPDDNTLLIDTPSVELYDVTPQVELVKPEKVAVKRRDIQYSSALVFRVNSTYIDPNLEGNRAELASIDKMMQSVISDSDYTITAVNIIGYASPEGSLASNMKLSEGRAASLESLMKREYRVVAPGLYSVGFGGENWDKLYEIVSEGDLAYRDDILNIIDNVSIEDGRESKLMALNGGETYRYLLKNIFPATRLVVVDVEYNIDAYDLERIGELIDVKPQNLSLEEMYRLSESYDVEDEEFEKIFLTAAKIYPDDEVALNNALVTKLRRGDIGSAEELVGRVDHDTELAELANSLGAYYMLCEEYDTAQLLLQRAIELGSARAESNMEQLLKKLDNLKEIEESESFRAKIYGE